VKKLIEKGLTYVSIAVFLAATVTYLMCSGVRKGDLVSAREMVGILDISELTPSETKRLDELLNREVSPCGDDVSLGKALHDREGCPLAPMAVDFIMDMLMEDYNVEEVSAAYMSRYAALKGLEIPIDGSPRMGAEDPQVMLVVFSDFGCPHCAKAAVALEDLVRSYPDDLAMVYKHYPLKSHPMAEMTAGAAFSAHRQGKFWEMHDTLFSAQGSQLTRERIDAMAVGLGLDIEEFEEDLGSPAATSAIEADVKLGKELGVDGTPTVFVNGRKLDAGMRGVEERVREEFLRHAVLEGRKKTR